MKGETKSMLAISAKASIGNPATKNTEESVIGLDEPSQARCHLCLFSNPGTPRSQIATRWSYIARHQCLCSFMPRVGFVRQKIADYELDGVPAHTRAATYIMDRI